MKEPDQNGNGLKAIWKAMLTANLAVAAFIAAVTWDNHTEIVRIGERQKVVLATIPELKLADEKLADRVEHIEILMGGVKRGP